MSACRDSLKDDAMLTRYDERLAALAQDLADAYELSGAIA